MVEGHENDVYDDNEAVSNHEEETQGTDRTPHTDGNTPSDITKNNTVHTDSTPRASKKRGAKRHTSSEVSSIERAINKLQKITEDNRNSQETSHLENEFDCFCKSLAIQLKNMPLHRALICQEKLQSVMTQERLSQMMNNNFAANERQYSAPNSSTSNIPSNIFTDNEYSTGTRDDILSPESSYDVDNDDPPENYTGNDVLVQALNSIVDL